jgi:hypothetical protein
MAAALLSTVYHDAMHDRYAEARDALLMSGTQETIQHADIATQVSSLAFSAFTCRSAYSVVPTPGVVQSSYGSIGHVRIASWRYCRCVFVISRFFFFFFFFVNLCDRCTHRFVGAVRQSQRERIGKRNATREGGFVFELTVVLRAWRWQLAQGVSQQARFAERSAEAERAEQRRQVTYSFSYTISFQRRFVVYSCHITCTSIWIC